jgi:hypothetical protein
LDLNSGFSVRLTSVVKIWIGEIEGIGAMAVPVREIAYRLSFARRILAI